MGQDDKNKKCIFVNNLLIVVSEWKIRCWSTHPLEDTKSFLIMNFVLTSYARFDEYFANKKIQ